MYKRQRIDGAGRMRTMLQILLPLTLPGLVAVGIYTFLNAWDDYLMSMTIMPVSYTHLDVYKRQALQLWMQRAAAG